MKTIMNWSMNGASHLDEKYEVLEGSIEMCFFLKRFHFFEMVMVDMRVNPDENRMNRGVS